jgi:aspartate aminotransferase/aminotransferase
MALKCILNEGNEVLIHEPAWLSYQEQVKLCGGKVGFIPFDCKVENFGDYMSDDTRCLILNNPNNPSGRVYTKEELLSLCTLTETRGCYLLMDEAYSDFVENKDFFTLARQLNRHPGIIVVNSLSKNMGMSGWRIGYIISNSRIIQHVLKLNQHLITCAPSLLQYYMARYFNQLLDITLPQINQLVLRRARISKIMDKMGIKYLEGSSTFYFFVSVKAFNGNTMDFALNLLLKSGVAVVPGSAYGRSTADFIRLSIGSESEERIEEGLILLKDLLVQSHVDKLENQNLLKKYDLPSFNF